MHLKSLFRPIFAFKVTISRHFAGYASVALETIWLHEPRDLIFLGPPMTLLCLSRYSSQAHSVLRCRFIHFSSICRRCSGWLMHLRLHPLGGAFNLAVKNLIRSCTQFYINFTVKMYTCHPGLDRCYVALFRTVAVITYG